MDIVRVDPFDEAALAAWHAAVYAADVSGREEFATPWPLAEAIVALQADRPDQVKEAYSGVEDGRVVVAGEISASLVDTLTHADVEVFTHPDHRRRGHGSTMLVRLEEAARAHGRSILNAEAAWAYDAGADGRGTAPAEFLGAHGFRFGLGDVHRILDLPVPDELLDRLAADAAPHHTAYELRSWAGDVPDELVEGFAALYARLMVEAPTGDLQREPESPDVEAVRVREEVNRRQGRLLFNTVALDTDGTVVAYTNFATTTHDPDNSYQWGTLVRRADRGHRLGMAIKAATMRLYNQSGVRARRMHTWNAEVNRHMIVINEQLGFRPVERMGEFQKTLV